MSAITMPQESAFCFSLMIFKGQSYSQQLKGNDIDLLRACWLWDPTQPVSVLCCPGQAGVTGCQILPSLLLLLTLGTQSC